MSIEPRAIAAPVPVANSSTRYLLIYLAVALPVCFLFLWRTDVVSMEGIIALGGRHMLETGQWWVPRLYGELYAFKPPLAYWMSAATEALFGRQTEFTLRLPSAVCGLAVGLALFVGMGRMMSPRCGLFAALAAVTSALFIEQVDTAGFELPLTLGVAVAMLAACRNLVFDSPDWRIWQLGYAGLLFGFMSKGMPAIVMFVPGIVVAAIAVRPFRRLLEPGHLAAAAVFAVGVGAYALIAYRAEGADAFHQHFGEIQHRSGQWTWGRALSTMLKPGIIFAVLLPWSIVAIGWILEALSRTWKRPGALSAITARTAKKLLPLPLAVGGARAARLAWTFLIVIVLAFIAVPTDDTRYYMALIGPLAMLAGLSLERLPGPWPGRTAIALTTIGLVVWVIQVGVVQPRRAEKRSLRFVAEAFRPHVPPGTAVYVDTQDSLSSLFFYLDRPVQAWRAVDDQPAVGSFIVMEGGQTAPLHPRTNVKIETLAEVVALDRHRYTLGRLSSIEP